mgnify:CR=1 FL=1
MNIINVMILLCVAKVRKLFLTCKKKDIQMIKKSKRFVSYEDFS